MFSLKDKTAVITGGAKGIGRSISRLFSEQGANVHILDVDVDAGEQTVSDIVSAGYSAQFHLADITIQPDIVTLFEQINRNQNGFDILVNNAGIAHIGTAETTEEADFDKVFGVNVKGAYNCAHAAIAIMKENRGGVILNMASVSASLGISERFAYSVSKGAVLTMTYSIAKDFIDDNIRCNAISPARIHTPFVDGYIQTHYSGREKEMFEKLSKTQPIGRMGEPDEVASLALFLCSDEASFITGSNYPIDGGFTTLNT